MSGPGTGIGLARLSYANAILSAFKRAGHYGVSVLPFVSTRPTRLAMHDRRPPDKLARHLVIAQNDFKLGMGRVGRHQGRYRSVSVAGIGTIQQIWDTTVRWETLARHRARVRPSGLQLA